MHRKKKEKMEYISYISFNAGDVNIQQKWTKCHETANYTESNLAAKMQISNGRGEREIERDNNESFPFQPPSLRVDNVLPSRRQTSFVPSGRLIFGGLSRTGRRAPRWTGTSHNGGAHSWERVGRECTRLTPRRVRSPVVRGLLFGRRMIDTAGHHQRRRNSSRCTRATTRRFRLISLSLSLSLTLPLGLWRLTTLADQFVPLVYFLLPTPFIQVPRSSFRKLYNHRFPCTVLDH